MKNGTPPDGSIHPGLRLLHPHLLPDKNGAQTRHVSVLIGSQLIGISRLFTTKCVLCYGMAVSHFGMSNEVDTVTGSVTRATSMTTILNVWLCQVFLRTHHCSLSLLRSDSLVHVLLVPLWDLLHHLLSSTTASVGSRRLP